MLIWKLIRIQSKPAKTNIYYLGWIRFTWNKHDSTNMETGIYLYCCFASGIAAAMFVVKNKSMYLL